MADDTPNTNTPDNNSDQPDADQLTRGDVLEKYNIDPGRAMTFERFSGSDTYPFVSGGVEPEEDNPMGFTKEQKKLNQMTQLSLDDVTLGEDAGPLANTRAWLGDDAIDDSLLEVLDSPFDWNFSEPLSDEEVFEKIQTERPDLIDEDASREEQMKQVEKYYKKRRQQRKRYTAHGSHFPLYRTMIQDQESTDEEIIQQFAEENYPNQEVDVGKVISDISELQNEVVEAAREDENINVIDTQSTPEDTIPPESMAALAEVANQYEEEERLAEKDGRDPENGLTLYQDPTTGEHLPFTSSGHIDQYKAEGQHRSLAWKDRSLAGEFLYGVARSGMGAGDMLLEITEFVTKLPAEIMGWEKPDNAASEKIQNWQDQIGATMTKGWARRSDEFLARDVDWLDTGGDDEEGAFGFLGEKATSAKYWAGTLGEFADSFVGGMSAVKAFHKWGDDLLRACFWTEGAPPIRISAFPNTGGRRPGGPPRS